VQFYSRELHHRWLIVEAAAAGRAAVATVRRFFTSPQAAYEISSRLMPEQLEHRRKFRYLLTNAVRFTYRRTQIDQRWATTQDESLLRVSTDGNLA
jgi:hypothetical protein